jgi:asparagine synthase (glutamine-hydrolysing)
MCGIAGTINFNGNTTKAIKKALYHRGPDEQDNYSYQNINLIHTRLSIQDISHGQQPFEYNEFVIVFNGEIYNHLDLRKEYLKDFKFTANSDTETLLYLYIKYKNKMFDMLDGMFAFCIFDKQSNKLILARDRVGKKPLYLYINNKQLLFASELNAIKAGVKNIQIDEEQISTYLRNGFFFKTTTPYKNVSGLEAGSIYEIDCNSLNIKKEK